MPLSWSFWLLHHQDMLENRSKLRQSRRSLESQVQKGRAGGVQQEETTNTTEGTKTRQDNKRHAGLY